MIQVSGGKKMKKYVLILILRDFAYFNLHFFGPKLVKYVFFKYNCCFLSLKKEYCIFPMFIIIVSSATLLIFFLKICIVLRSH